MVASESDLAEEEKAFINLNREAVEVPSESDLANEEKKTFDIGDKAVEVLGEDGLPLSDPSSPSPKQP